MPRAARVAMILRTVVRLTPSIEDNAFSDGSGSPSPSFEIRSTASLKARLNTASVFMAQGTLYAYLSIKNNLTSVSRMVFYGEETNRAIPQKDDRAPTATTATRGCCLSKA